VLRLSIDAQAPGSVGPFSRRGASRVVGRAADHHLEALDKLIPLGIFRPDEDELYLYFTAGPLTADFMGDGLQAFWTWLGRSFPHVTSLLINLDNEPENRSHRTPFMYRLVPWADAVPLTLHLADYPPDHSP
jgi:hypothetical protein